MTPNNPSIADITTLAVQLPEKFHHLKMLVLFGSRARGDFRPNSDWDFAAVYDEAIYQNLTENPFAVFELSGIISNLLNIPESKIDVIDLGRCSALLAHYVARDGKVLYEQEPKQFEQFRRQALKSTAEMKAIRQSLRAKLDERLRNWGYDD